jgi:Mg2+-importing ATPase
MNLSATSFWNLPASEVIRRLGTSFNGLDQEEARLRLSRFGSNILKPRKRSDVPTLLLAQFKSPIVLILLVCVGLSFVLHDRVDAGIILAIVLVSALLGFWQERGAASAVEELLAMVKVVATALRDGVQQQVPMEEIVLGDVVLVSAGDGIPGDCLILESKDLFVDEATLTGETFPVEKTASVVSSDPSSTD